MSSVFNFCLSDFVDRSASRYGCRLARWRRRRLQSAAVDFNAPQYSLFILFVGRPSPLHRTHVPAQLRPMPLPHHDPRNKSPNRRQTFKAPRSRTSAPPPSQLANPLLLLLLCEAHLLIYRWRQAASFYFRVQRQIDWLLLLLRRRRRKAKSWHVSSDERGAWRVGS